MNARNDRTSRSVLPRVLVAVAVPPILSALFVPIFHSVQAYGLPAGSLEGIDLTPYAQRDERMLVAFACLLILLVGVAGLGARSGRDRLIVLVAGGIAATASYVAVIVSLIAG